MAEVLNGEYADDDDLPTVAAAQPAAQPRDQSGQFVATKPTQNEPTHSPYMLAKAQQYGITVSPSWTPDFLDAILTTAEAQRTAAQKAAAVVPVAKVEEPAFDWGDDETGKPMTEEQARAAYPRAVFNSIKASHELPKLAKANAELRESIERDRQERSAIQAERSLNKVLATRPDLFGEKPAAIVPGSVEYHRRQAVINHLNGLLASKQQTTLEADAAAALVMFGPAPTNAAPVKGKPKTPSPTDLAAAYKQAELARPSGRRGTELLDRRALMVQAELERQRENGSPVSVASEDDDDDLPDPRKG